MYCHGENSEWMYKNCQRTCGKCYGGQQFNGSVVVDFKGLHGHSRDIAQALVEVELKFLQEHK